MQHCPSSLYDFHHKLFSMEIFMKILKPLKIFSEFGTIGLENMWKQILGQWNLNHQKTI